VQGQVAGDLGSGLAGLDDLVGLEDDFRELRGIEKGRVLSSASVTKSSGKPARRSSPASTNCSRKLRSLVSAPRFPLRNLLACRQGAFPESLCGTLRRALSLGFSQRAPLYGSR
jgi:hypothetical protein